MMRKHVICLIISIFFINFVWGCNISNNNNREVERVYRVFITPAFYPIWEKHQKEFASCVQKHLQDERILYQVTYAYLLRFTPQDILLSLYESEIPETRIYKLGTIKLKFIVHGSNPHQIIDWNDLREVLIGKKSSWESLRDANQKESNNEGIQLYMYPSFDEITTGLKERFEINQPLTGTIIVLPARKDMIRKVNEDKRSLGAILDLNSEDSQLGIKMINVNGNDGLSFPLLVHLHLNSDKSIIHLVGCFQGVLSSG